MKKYSFQRSVAYALALVLCLMNPFTVLAENGEFFENGSYLEKTAVTGFEEVTETAEGLSAAEAVKEETLSAAEALSEEKLPAAEGITEEDPAEEETFIAEEASGLSLLALPEATPSEAVFAAGQSWYKSVLPKENIKFITFRKEAFPQEMPEGAWYADKDNRGAIICYFYDNAAADELTICNTTEGDFFLNEDAAGFLSGFFSLEQIYGLELLHTERTTNMSDMFANCTTLVKLDLVNFDTSKVTNGQRFTQGTTNLRDLSLGTGWTGACILSKPAQPVTDGLWYDAAAKKAYEPDKIPAKKAADYTARELYPVYFNMQGHGSQIPYQLTYFQGKVTRPADPAEAGWVFCGWYTDDNFAKAWDFDKDVLQKAEMTLYAKWQTPDYTLYSGGGWYPGTAVATKSEIEKIVIGDYTPDGTEDDGWNADGSRNGGVRCFVKDKVLYMTPYTAGHVIVLPYSCDQMFEGFESLKAVEGTDRLDMSKVGSMKSFFEGCSSFTDFGSFLSGVHGVVNMERMFAGCRALTQVDLSRLDMSACESISGMFIDCTGLKTVDLNALNTSHVTDMSLLFSGCTSLEKVRFRSAGGTNLFDSTGVTSMRSMFDSCYALKDLDLSGLSTNNVVYMNYMFRDCRSLEGADMSGMDVSKVQSMSNMFAVCTSLKSLDLSTWNTAAVTDMSSMLSGDTALEQINLGGQFTTESVKDIRYMFNKCSALTALDLSNFNTASVAPGKGVGFNASMDVLATVKLGTGWNGSVALAAPNVNVTDGFWYNSAGEPVKAENIPAGVAETYKSRITGYTVHFNMMGHGRREADDYYAAGSLLTEPDKPAETGYVFEGWYSDEKLKTLWDFKKNTMPAHDMTLYAKWSTVEYTVKLESNYRDAKQMDPLTCLYNVEYTIPKMTITRPGYEYESWNTAEDGNRKKYEDGSKFINLSKKNHDTVTLYAQWIPNTFNVQFDGNGATSGTMDPIKGCEYDSFFELSTNQFRRNGYTFDGWNTEKNGSGARYADHASVRNLTTEKDGWVTLYAQWIRKTTGEEPGKQTGGGSGSGSSGSGSAGSGSTGSGSSGGGFSGGSSSGGAGGSAGGGLSLQSAAAKQSLPAWVDTRGSWTNNSKDNSWTYKKQDGTQAKNEWVCAYNPYAAAGSRAYDWFFFDESGNMRVGWFTDKDGNTYYLNPASDGSRGKMMVGRVLIDGVWYTFSDAEGSGTMGALIR